jgi:cytochrome c oxidase subunit IV
MPEHVSSKKLYYIIFAALLVLTYVTVGVSKIDLGAMNTIVAMAIAVTKALLVVLFFMHVRYSTKLTKLVVAGGFVWLGIMFLLTMMDFASRGWLLPNS